MWGHFPALHPLYDRGHRLLHKQNHSMRVGLLDIEHSNSFPVRHSLPFHRNTLRFIINFGGGEIAMHLTGDVQANYLHDLRNLVFLHRDLLGL